MAGALLVVDGPSLLYRSFFALPESISAPDGTPVNALLGSANAVLRVAAEHGPWAVVMCFGQDAADYRVAAYPAYHAARPPVPDALASQFADAPAFFAALGWSCASTEGYEADDLLHSFALVEEEAGGRSLLLTGDRDLYQCASPRTTVLYLKTGVKGVEEVDAEEVRRRYGVAPELVPDFIALRGDPSDGLPGAKGIGEKTAGDLLRRHGSLEGALAKALRETPKVRGALCGQADELRSFLDIATLRRLEVERPANAPTDLPGGAAAARRRGMNRLAERLEKGRLER